MSDLRLLHEEGVRFLAGSDFGGVPLIFPCFSLHEELRLLVERAGMTPLEALQTATRNPPIFFGMLLLVVGRLIKAPTFYLAAGSQANQGFCLSRAAAAVASPAPVIPGRLAVCRKFPGRARCGHVVPRRRPRARGVASVRACSCRGESPAADPSAGGTGSAPPRRLCRRRPGRGEA
ncbi:MAG: amidohydrolase family protein [Gemmatimonadaceae bacterium]